AVAAGRTDVGDVRVAIGIAVDLDVRRGQVAGAFAIDVKVAVIAHDPDTMLRFRAEDEQAIPRPALVHRLPGNGAFDGRQVGGPGIQAHDHHSDGGEEESYQHFSPDEL